MTDHRFDTVTHVHFLGLGGVGVSGIARIMLSQGYKVSGSDAKHLPVIDELAEQGARVFMGYRAENFAAAHHDSELGPIELVIASSVATAENPERQAAEAAGIPVLHRSEGLAMAMQGHKVLTVAGTHGKTTTSSMAATVLTEAGLDPTYAVGAAVAGLGPNAHSGTGEWFVAEADESDGTLLNYRPDMAIITNIEADHLDFYGTEEAVHQVFEDFSHLVSSDGALILCADDPGCRHLADQLRATRADNPSVPEVYFYGHARGDHPVDLEMCDSEPAGSGQRVSYRFAGRLAAAGEFSVALAQPGTHNALNAAAVVLAGHLIGISPDETTRGLRRFHGSARRFEFHGEVAGVKVYDDYAHHPTEVRAAIHAAQTLSGCGKVHAIFQPHLFSRTRDFAAEFAEALSTADSVRVLEIYPAREEPIPGVDASLITKELSETLRSGFPAAGQVAITPAEAIETIVDRAQPGDLVLTLGAGDINASTQTILDQLAARAQSPQQ
ncbi:UDP-N-acetylmuramate--L-alanine ligase [Auritidibacter ignavus]|uniref:UDP-N-acetylmuramate--L-alanine ligase n=1 Tax=Auritidibacter ignavus TaxID=678932 RepID=UPI00244B69CC|nr:UDP-N-acetylmuramate--L-alanine ligase [Auritidibacter ignavus]WGH84605.1 UDP-N-acetylmuramate--L-alanine ligase [Auritidibacter ignavus]WHS27732.1 UDP-N-acetylmuramate--L-alanine ligase [Auritidibacter ignavus]